MKVIPEFIRTAETKLLQNLANSAPFVPGRQADSYEKCPIAMVNDPTDFLWRLQRRALNAIAPVPPYPAEMDCFFIRYRPDLREDAVPLHIDPAPPGKEHHRLNLILDAGQGGDLYVNSELVPLRVQDAYVFRPDLEPHKVTRVVTGQRLVFSVGALFSANKRVI